MPTPEKEWPMDPIGRKLHEKAKNQGKPVILGPPPDVLEMRKIRKKLNKPEDPKKETPDTDEKENK
ncbi:MAG: hypothetical protein K5891_07960 [Lachnospiraceae bacterium]|jgi:hypothetical protein|nr:hypothetical protein [Lachnospiraceae bacterium]